MGSTSRHITTTAVAAIVALGLGACSDGSDDAALDAPAATEEAATEATVQTGESGDRLLSGAPADAATGGVVAPESPETDDVTAMQVAGQAIAIEARATLQADDVRAAVDRITTTVTTRGGRVAAADIDYAPPTEDGDQTGSRATLVLEVPPGELPAVGNALEELGTVLSFDQLAEDVTDQLADLDTRIANLRASVERVRALYAEAVDIDSIVRLEAELTRRETDLEVLLASQQSLEDRVTMSTLTVEVMAIPIPLDAADDDRPGVLDALAGGWGAFVGGLFAIVLVLAAIAPFVLTGLTLAVLALWMRQLVLRRQRDHRMPPPVSESARETESASRPG